LGVTEGVASKGKERGARAWQIDALGSSFALDANNIRQKERLEKSLDSKRRSPAGLSSLLVVLQKRKERKDITSLGSLV
jgi:hypothetical protein